VVASLVENMTMHAQFPERLVEADCLSALPALVARHGLGARLLLVADDATWNAAGAAASAALDSTLLWQHCRLGKQVKATLAKAEQVMEATRDYQASGIVAIGSGTINDLCKYAAAKLAIPYMVVATAASMNGYSSANASLAVGHHKQSFAARAPVAVLADTRVIAHAPKRLTRAGVGDLFCRSTVVADRYLSHCVLGTPFEGDIFQRLQAHEPWLLANAGLYREMGNTDFARALMLALLDGGDAMTEVGSSAVASQGEHMIAHTLELLYGGELRDVLHGELVAVTTTTMALLQHQLLLSTPRLKHLAPGMDVFTRFFGRDAGTQMAEQFRAKQIPEAELDAREAAFQRDWPEIRAQLLGMILPAGAVERMYLEVGLANKPEGLGLIADRYNAAMSYAYLTRERFTFLDLGAMNARRAGVL